MKEKVLDGSVLLNYANLMETRDTSVLWHGKQVYVKKYIPLHEVVSIVGNVISGCLINDGRSISPIMADFIFKSEIITHYSSVVLPEDIDDRYKSIYLTDIFDFIKNNTNKIQIEEMQNSIDKILNHIE